MDYKDGEVDCCYLVDSENIKDTWIDLLDVMREEDRLLVFYTANSTHIRCEQVEKIMQKNDGRTKWVQCYEGSNALDFQLVTMLGSMIAESRAKEYVIVSKDTGFDAVVKFWSRENIVVRRIRGAEEIEAQRKREEKKDTGYSREDAVDNFEPLYYNGRIRTFTPEESPADVAVRTAQMVIERREDAAKRKKEKKQEDHEHEKDKPGEKDKSKDKGKGKTKEKEKAKNKEQTRQSGISRMAKSISISDMSLFHNALVAFFGAEKGDSYYKELKSEGEGRSSYRQFYLKDRHQRIRNYVELMLEMEHLDTKDAAELYRVLAKAPKKELQKLNDLMLKKFGQKKGHQYYKIVRRHLNIIRKI